MEYLEENSEEGNETIHGLEIMFYTVGHNYGTP